MAFLFLDGFDCYNNSLGTTTRWTTGANFPNPPGAFGRFGGQGYRLNNTGTTLKKSLASALGTVGVAFARQLVNTIVRNPLIYFLDDAGGVTHLTLYVDTDGSLKLYRGNGTTLLGSSAVGAVAAGTYFQVEMKVTISDSVGAVEVRLNGNATPIINLSAIDTRNGGNATVDAILFAGTQGADNLDDVGIWDTSGSDVNDFVGDLRVERVSPNGNGNSSQFVGSDGNSTDNYLLVDDGAAPNDDTDYVASSTVADKDTYAMGNITPAVATIKAVQTFLYARKDDAGTRKIASIVRLSATESQGADFTLASTYGAQADIFHQKPGGGAWSVSDVNSAEAGQVVVA